MWQDNPHDSPAIGSDVHSNQRLGSLLSSNKWQMQHEHLLQKVSTTESTALQAEFLQIHVLEHLEPDNGSVIGGIRIGFSAFLFCFFEGSVFGLTVTFLESWFFKSFLFMLLFEADGFSLLKKIQRSWPALGFLKHHSVSTLLKAETRMKKWIKLLEPNKYTIIH